eukprot:1037793-Pyramimonas_sp.AAC.1
MEKGPVHEGKILLEMSTNTGHIRGLSGAPEDAAIGGLIQFGRRHMMLMVGYAHAAGPDWEKASLTTLLDYHEWVMKKAYEGDRTREKIKRLMDADYEMRTKWTLGYSTEEHPTLTAAIQHHRSESAYLFQDINKKTNTYGQYEQNEDNNRSRASSAK